MYIDINENKSTELVILELVVFKSTKKMGNMYINHISLYIFTLMEINP